MISDSNALDYTESFVRFRRFCLFMERSSTSFGQERIISFHSCPSISQLLQLPVNQVAFMIHLAVLTQDTAESKKMTHPKMNVLIGLRCGFTGQNSDLWTLSKCDCATDEWQFSPTPDIKSLCSRLDKHTTPSLIFFLIPFSKCRKYFFPSNQPKLFFKCIWCNVIVAYKILEFGANISLIMFTDSLVSADVIQS